MVDALASGASGGNFVEVRVLFWAPFLSYKPSYTPKVLLKPACLAGFLYQRADSLLSHFVRTTDTHPKPFGADMIGPFG